MKDMDRIEKFFEIEYDDEWIIANGKAYRTQPDSYSWTKYFVNFGGEIIGGDRIEQNHQIALEYIYEILANNPNRCNTFDIDLENFGFKPYNGEFEAGLYKHTNDNPSEIYEQLRDKFPDKDIVFDLNSTGQFSSNFGVYISE